MIAEPPRRSRIAWPHREPPEPAPPVPIPPHRHRSARRQWAAIVVLYLVLALNTYLVVLNYQYVLGRGQYRDAEAARMEQQSTERMREFACDLLDGLPQGPVLDPLRVRYECEPGNGLAPEELSPEARQELQGAGQAPVTASPQQGLDRYFPQPAPTALPPVDRKPPRQPLITPPAAPTTAPAPAAPPAPPEPGTQAPPVPPTQSPAATPPPLVDLGPVTDPLCNRLGVCL